MSIKDLFRTKETLKVLSKKSVTDAASDIESVGLLRRSLEDKKRFLPQVDFSIPGSFSKFGSAEKYYEAATYRVYAQYPYDGSLKEKLEWELSSSYLDLHIFENEYPRTNGYVNLGLTGQAGTPALTFPPGGDYSWANPAYQEFIEIKGGPNKDPNNTALKKIFPSDGGQANIYDVSQNRESNLELDFANNGVTVEFWLNKQAFNVAKWKKEAIFDVWNGVATSSSDYGRLTIELSGTTASESPFYVTAQSGTAGAFNQQIGVSIAGTGSLTSWNHYAFSFVSASSGVETKFYVNGDLNQTAVLGTSGIGEVTGSLVANIGCLRTPPSGNIYDISGMGSPEQVAILNRGVANLSASLDEFRFWKTKRSSQQIGRHWFAQVGGGTNTDIANTDLGIYFKFNEGITTNDSTDAVVLDYSGRISNGSWTGYTAAARSTESAMVLSNAAATEFKDPIVRTNHPAVNSFITTKKIEGKSFDSYNTSQIYNSLPSWIIEEDHEGAQHLRNLTQIISSYLDTLHLQIDLLPHIHDTAYSSGSLSKVNKPLPFAKNLLTSRGLIASDIFADASVLEYIGNRDEDREYEVDLESVKNTIYKNIYNNLSFIYKSKGTEKSFRNLIRCFGVDDELIKVNMYANNYTFSFEDNFKHTSRRTSYADFNDPTRFEATVHQYFDAANDNTVSFISGSKAEYKEEGLAVTFETEVLFPEKFDKTSVHFYDNPGTIISLFGAHTADTSLKDTETTTAANDVANFQVYALRTEANSDDVTFKITGSAGGFFPLLTSSIFTDTYNNERWNLAVRVAPTKFPNIGAADSSSSADTYTINFYGVNTSFGDVRGEFELTGTITYDQGLSIVSNPKRFFIGAHRQNLTGSIIDRTDVKISNCKIWYDYISNEALKMHALDPHNFGTPNPARRAFLFEDNIGRTSIPEIETLALHWTFENVTSSNASGQFVVSDLSSGSSEDAGRHGWISQVINRQHSGQGYAFPANDSDAINKDYIFSYQPQLPEVLTSNDTVNIINQDDLQFTRDHRPQTFFFGIEKSMYQEVSHEMLKMFSTVKDFNNLIGAPVNRYRQDYKELGKLRQLYFERVRNVPDFDKFVDFYKWFDESLGQLIAQMLPASAATSGEIRTVVESHILERNKYWNKFPTLDSKEVSPETGAKSVNELLYNWKEGHAPLSGKENDNCLWWKEKAERKEIIASGDAGVDASRTSILSANLQVLNRKFTTPHRLKIEKAADIMSGISFHENKKADAFRSEISNLGTPNTISASFENYFKDCRDERPETEKTRISLSIDNLSVLDGEAKGEMFLPFSVHSSSANSSFALATDKEITNLHTDFSNASYETPMQSPFTQEHVGGLQHRNVGAIDFLNNNANNNVLSRPEGFRIRINGSSVFVHGATKDEVGNTNLHLPRAIFYRDGTSKRPVNIKNIKTSTSNGILGNYQRDYEVVQTSNRRTNNVWFIDSGSSEDVATPSILFDEDSFKIGTGSTSIFETTEYTKPERGQSKHVFVERFSAPGGPETAGDANGGPGLDALSAEYSVYSTMNYRNPLVREVFNELSTEHAGQFGTTSSVTARSLDYNTAAAFHKINRNALRRIEFSDAGNAVATASVRDNLFVQHAIPQGDLNYAWITASAISAPLGFARDSRKYPTAADTITFLSSSDFGSMVQSGVRYFGRTYKTYLAGAGSSYEAGSWLFTDFVGLNTNIYEPISASSNTLGYPADTVLGTHGVAGSGYASPLVTPISTGGEEAGIPNTFNSILLNRNGPYGYPTFKQVRTGEHAIARHQRRNNRLDHTLPGGPDVVALGSMLMRPPTKTTVIEPPLSSRFKPMRHTLRINTTVDEGRNEDREFILKHTYANNLSYFANKFLDDNLTRLDGQPLQNDIKQIYNDITDMYIRADVDDPTNPVNGFVSLRYKEAIYPREENTFLNRTRSRVNYDVASVLKWRETRINRASGSLTSTLGEAQTASLWPLDGRFDGSAFSTAATLRVDQPGVGASSPGLDNSGELLNNYAQFHNGTAANVKPSALYARRDLFYYNTTEVFAVGDAKWQAADQAGKKPFYDTYDDFSDEIKRVGKDFSIIPEFRVSDHIEYYMNEKGGDFRADIDDIFKTEGASIVSSADTTDIENKKFYQVYSTSDFLKYFDVVEQDHKDNDNIGSANAIRLSCKAIKKFRPRDGFYPVQRTLQLANLFNQSYSSVIAGDQRPTYQAFFAPGIMYNTIKSGVAVDYPVYTSPYDKFLLDDAAANGSTYLVLHSANHRPKTTFINASVGRYTYFNGSNKTEYILSSSFNSRIPFEALIDPTIIGQDLTIHDNEPHVSASLNFTSSFFAGASANVYTMAAHNFTAEVASFYLRGGGFTSITSKSSREPGFLSVERVGNLFKEYTMDVILTAQLGQDTTVDDSLIGTKFGYITKTVEMYNNPTAFGPLCNSNATGGPVEYTTLLPTLRHTASYVDTSPFTPPYYNGFARARLTYRPVTEEITLNTVLSQLTASYYRGGLANSGSTTAVAVTDAMQITSSINVLDPDKCLMTDRLVEFDDFGNILSIKEDPNAGSRWVISTKFETPILDFKNVSVEIPDTGSTGTGVIPKGMWHQYGQIPTGQNQGIFLQVKNIPDEDITNSALTGSLADLVGFDRQQRTKKIGQLPESKEVFEAVVAVPFLEGENGDQRFLPIPRLRINDALNRARRGEEFPDDRPGKSVFDMVQKMSKYVFPPNLDFITSTDIQPFAMYIFEFSHAFSQQDLADMWQNLSPESATSFELAQSSIEHNILREELIDSADIDGATSSGKLRWMVFKVKQKASKNYYEKTLATSDDDRFKAGLPGREDEVPDYSYNWPYDYFSLVELVKLEAEVEYTNKEEE